MEMFVWGGWVRVLSCRELSDNNCSCTRTNRFECGNHASLSPNIRKSRFIRKIRNCKKHYLFAHFFKKYIALKERGVSDEE